MKQVNKTLSLILIAFPIFGQAADVAGESRSTTFGGLPGIVVEISGASARQLMLNLNIERNFKLNGQVEVKGKNVVCVLADLKTKCIIRFDNDGAAAELHR